MNIQEATRAALRLGCEITRGIWEGLGIWIKPTNSGECCIIGAKGQAPCPRWEPQAEDLMADDWQCVSVSEP